MHLQSVIHIVPRVSAEIPNAGIEGGKRPLHIVRMQTRAPRLNRIREIRLSAEADHTAKLIRPDRIGDAEIRIDLHVPHPRVDRLVDRAQTETLIFQLLVHAVDQRVHLCGIRLTAVQLRKELVLLVSRNEPLNHPREILRSCCTAHILSNHCRPSKKLSQLGLLYHIHSYMQAELRILCIVIELFIKKDSRVTCAQLSFYQRCFYKTPSARFCVRIFCSQSARERCKNSCTR